MSGSALFSHILVPLENSPADETIISHVRRIATVCGSKVTLIHVADGFMARNQPRLGDSPEMEKDRDYLESRQKQLMKDGLVVDAILECGEPAEQILAFADKSRCDLIAMATHGHRGLTDIILGSVASSVRHKTDVPVLLIRVPRG